MIELIFLSIAFAIVLDWLWSGIQAVYAYYRKERNGKITRFDGPLVLILAFSGCISLDSLAPGVDRTCVGDRCYMIGTHEQIDRHCRKSASMFDNGIDPNSWEGLNEYEIRACTQYVPDSQWKFRIWLCEDHLEAVVHESCHIQIWQGRVEGPHSNCHDFGAYKDKRL